MVMKSERERERRGRSTNSNCSGLKWDRTSFSTSNCREIKDSRWEMERSKVRMGDGVNIW